MYQLNKYKKQQRIIERLKSMPTLHVVYLKLAFQGLIFENPRFAIGSSIGYTLLRFIPRFVFIPMTCVTLCISLTTIFTLKVYHISLLISDNSATNRKITRRAHWNVIFSHPYITLYEAINIQMNQPLLSFYNANLLSSIKIYILIRIF